ncbi:MAG: endonuclease domain-containing protein [Ignavibacteriaceae bacterium]|nr:endonuclease domain-containing protein [Ignavibacteriaceae bacterium]
MRKKKLIIYARELRKNSTIAERRLWQRLRSRNFLNLKFRRQEPIGNYIVDFICYEKKLIVELDGGQHNEFAEKDIPRTEFLEKEGFKVLRFWNTDVINNINGVLTVIKENCNVPSP